MTGKYRDAAHSIYNLRFNVPQKIPVLFHNGSNYDYHFIIKKLANGFKGKFGCLVENTENCKSYLSYLFFIDGNEILQLFLTK